MWSKIPTDLNSVKLLTKHLHLWRINLDISTTELTTLETHLSTDEVSRAERYHFPQHRQRFIAGRGILRQILGTYLEVEGAAVELTYLPRGKPILGGKFAHSSIKFNLSHSQSMAVCVVAYDYPVGVDIEYIRPMSDMEAVAKRFFLTPEYEQVRSLRDNEQQQAFFRYWTCKEAYLKATGEGLGQLETVGISLTPTTRATLLTGNHWHLWEVVPGENYRGAVVVGGVVADIHYYRFN